MSETERLFLQNVVRLVSRRALQCRGEAQDGELRIFLRRHPDDLECMIAIVPSDAYWAKLVEGSRVRPVTVHDVVTILRRRLSMRPVSP